MTYDLHSFSWERTTASHTALYPNSNDSERKENVDFCVQLLVNMGIPKYKLIMGMATYGITFALKDPNNNGVGAPANPPDSSIPPRYTYLELCQKNNSGQLNYSWENTQKVPYAFQENMWVGFDDVRSITIKAEYINDRSLGGGMFWNIDGDDYSNVCKLGKFPIISTASKIVLSGVSLISLF